MYWLCIGPCHGSGGSSILLSSANLFRYPSEARRIMSIYATLWRVYFPRDGWYGAGGRDEDFVEVYCQAVPGHIGHPEHGYPDDTYDFLPPVRMDYNEDDGYNRHRAVYIFCRECHPDRGPSTQPQHHTDYLLMFTGEEYERITWQELWDRIAAELRACSQDPEVWGYFVAPDGTTTPLTDEGAS